MQRAEGFREELKALKPSLQEEYGVEAIGIFGSYVRDEQHDENDLDVLVRFSEPIGLLDFVRSENELTEHVGVDVDLVTEQSLKPRIEARVSDEVVSA